MWTLYFIVSLLVSMPLHNTVLVSVNKVESNNVLNCNESIPGFNYLKSFDFSCEPAKQFEFPYVLVKQSRYNVKLCLEQSVEGLQIALFNSHREKLGVFTLKADGSDSFVYESSATGIYYIAVLNPRQLNAQGRLSLSFQKKL